MPFYTQGQQPQGQNFAQRPLSKKALENQLYQESIALAKLERQIVEETREQNKVLLPFLAKQEGFDVQVDPTTGQITGISQIETPEMARDKEIRGLFQERSLKALKGELPVDPALERSLEEQETELRNRLMQQFGPGYETSTPGIQTMGEFFRSAEELRSGARTGQLTLAEQLGLTREQQEMYRRGTSQDVLRQFGVADPMSFAGALGQVQQGYLQAAAPFTEERRFQESQDLAKRGQNMAMAGSVISGLGSIAAAPMTGGTSLAGSYMKRFAG